MPGALPISAVHSSCPVRAQDRLAINHELFVLHHHFQLLLVASELC